MSHLAAGLPLPASARGAEADVEVNLAYYLARATERLQHALGLDRREARLEARILAARALGVDRAWLVAHDRDTLSPDQAEAVEALVARREQGEPVAYILGEKEFYGRMFKVTPDVLIPRPETELLVEAALARIPMDRPCRVLDLGTGSGCIAITIALERPGAQVLAADQSAACVTLAHNNAKILSACNCTFIQSDWFSELTGETFEVIVSNPPYIAPEQALLDTGDLRFEPRHALSAEGNGLAHFRTITSHASKHLAPHGWLLVEHGYDQGGQVLDLLEQTGFYEIRTLTDLARHPRVTLGSYR